MVADIEAAMKHWTEVLGVGAFFRHIAQTARSWDGGGAIRRMG